MTEMTTSKRKVCSLAAISLLQLILQLLVSGHGDGYDWFLFAGVVPLITAGVGAAALRVWKAEWRDLLWAGAGATLISSLLHTIAAGTPKDNGGLVVIAFTVVLGSSGAFLLPLFDPLAHQQEPKEGRLIRWKVFVATLPLLTIILLSHNDYNPVQLMVAGVILVTLFGLGLLLQGTAWKKAGLYCAATGMLLLCEMLVVLLIASLPIPWHVFR